MQCFGGKVRLSAIRTTHDRYILDDQQVFAFAIRARHTSHLRPFFSTNIALHIFSLHQLHISSLSLKFKEDGDDNHLAREAQLCHCNGCLIPYRTSSDQIFPFASILIFLSLDNLTRENAMFDIENL